MGWTSPVLGFESKTYKHSDCPSRCLRSLRESEKLLTCFWPGDSAFNVKCPGVAKEQCTVSKNKAWVDNRIVKREECCIRWKLSKDLSDF